MLISQKELILQSIEIIKEYVHGNFKTIFYFLELEAWDVAALFFDDVFVSNLIQANSCLMTVLDVEKEEN